MVTPTAKYRVGDKLVGDWTKWVAWYPVKLHGKYVWLQTVYWRGGYYLTDNYGYTEVEYGDIFDVVKTEKDEVSPWPGPPVFPKSRWTIA